MILRPVSPVSAFGPADLEPAGGVHHRRLHARGIDLGELPEHRVDHLGDDVGLQQGLDVDLLAVLRGDQDGVDPDRLPVSVLDGDLALAVGPQIRNDARFADVGQAP